MALTEQTTRTFSVTCDQDGRVKTMHVQHIIEVERDGEVISRAASAADPISAEDLATLLHPADRARLAAALAT